MYNLYTVMFVLIHHSPGHFAHMNSPKITGYGKNKGKQWFLQLYGYMARYTV